MTNSGFTVATASQLRGSKTWNGVEDIPGVAVMDYASIEASKGTSNRLKRRSAVRKSMRIALSSVHEDTAIDERKAPSTSQSELQDTIAGSGTGGDASLSPSDMFEKMPQLLLPLTYSPSEDSGTKSAKSRSSFNPIVTPNIEVNDTRTTSPCLDNHSTPAKAAEVGHDGSHDRQSNASSHLFRRVLRNDGAIYFTPSDVTKSQIFLSSPVDSLVESPTQPTEHKQISSAGGDEVPTPRASLSRPPSEIYVGPLRLDLPVKRPTKEEKLDIKPEQLDQLVVALVKSRLVQQDVRKHWWDDADIPDDESVSTMTTVSTPTLTSATTLYTHSNDVFLNNGMSLDVPQAMADHGLGNGLEAHSQQKRILARANVPFGGVALADPSVHGSPIRYISKDFRVGNNVLHPGSCSFITVPYGVDVECNLRLETLPTRNNFTSTSSIKVLLQCINQVVDRKTGKKSSLLLFESDVTIPFIRASLAELSAISSISPSSITITPTSPATPNALLNSPEIDWIALADSLQATALVADTIDTALKSVSHLTRESCSMSTLSLLSELHRIKDTHQDFLILKTTKWHDNGIMRNVRLPWVSRRLWGDWYERDEARGKSEREKNVVVGYSAAAKRFQSGIVSEVARRSGSAAGGEEAEFACRVRWNDDEVVVKCVPLGDGAVAGGAGKMDVWVCFVQGMFELDGKEKGES